MNSINSLGNCEVCRFDAAKYSCPRCEVKTCSISCVNRHKQELECDGIKHETGIKELEKFSDNDTSQDSRIMNKYIEAVGQFKIKTERLYKFPSGFRILYNQAHKRNIRLQIVPNSVRHKNNTSYFNWKRNQILWRIDWVFHGTDVKYSDHKVSGRQKLNNAAGNYFSRKFHDDKAREKMKYFISAGIKNVIFLMKTKHGKYYELDSEESITNNLKFKSILEYPEILVVLSIHKDQFSDLLCDEIPE